VLEGTETVPKVFVQFKGPPPLRSTLTTYADSLEIGISSAR
jgi:hypothetical protein